MQIYHQISKLLSALEYSRLIPSLMTWPIFSLSSFLVISRLTRQGINPNTVLDIGANIGQFATASSKLLPNATIHSCEPDPVVVQVLKKNLRRFDSVLIYNTAVGDIIGDTDFQVNMDSQVSSILSPSSTRLMEFPTSTVRDVIKVKINTIDGLFSNMEMQPPILLKIDVQGYEDRVIMGATKLLKTIDYVILELSLKQLYEGELSFMEMLELMNSRGFSFLRPLNWNLSPSTGEMIEMDALFSRNITID